MTIEPCPSLYSDCGYEENGETYPIYECREEECDCPGKFCLAKSSETFEEELRKIVKHNRRRPLNKRTSLIYVTLTNERRKEAIHVYDPAELVTWLFEGYKVEIRRLK